MIFNPVTRRLFLKGAGAAMAIPFLPSIARTAGAAEANDPPVRFVAFISRYGIHYENWHKTSATPMKAIAPEAAWSMPLNDFPSKTLNRVTSNRFAEFYDSMTFFRGLDSLGGHGHCHNAPLISAHAGKGGVAVTPPFRTRSTRS